MRPIVVIAPESDSYQMVQRVAAELGIQKSIRLHLTGLSRSLSTARQAEIDGAHVIVVRGWSANQIVEAGVKTPVVFLPISMQDLVYVLQQAQIKAHTENPRIGFIVYPQLQNELAAISALLQVDLRIYPSSSNPEEMRRTVEQAVNDGVDIIIGGETSLGFAETMGIRGQLLICGETSIRQALLEANRIVYSRALEQTQSLKFKTVVEHSRDGIVSLDASGRVMLINPVARRMFRLKNDITQHSFKDILDLPNLSRCLLLGKSIVDEMAEFEGRRLLFSAIPIHMGSVVHGAVITFQEPHAIAAKESKIRDDAVHSEMVAHHVFDDILGASLSVKSVVQRAQKFAHSHQPVLIQGETGTGKELFAQAIHNASPRRGEPFVAINCGALPQSLLESELFGYEEGAFTGASRKGKPGLFELAHKGTLFLDEVGELDLRAQRRLLRVLETQKVLRISGTRNICVNVRIVAATNANLWDKVQRNLFRADLFYRLSVLLLTLPALRDRREDIMLLAHHFLDHADENSLSSSEFTADAVDMLRNYAWPGNVRELRYFIHRLCITAPSVLNAEAVQTELLPFQSLPVKRRPSLPSLEHQGKSDEKESILLALGSCNGHQGNAAKLLQISRSTLYRKMRKHGL